MRSALRVIHQLMKRLTNEAEAQLDPQASYGFAGEGYSAHYEAMMRRHQQAVWSALRRLHLSQRTVSEHYATLLSSAAPFTRPGEPPRAYFESGYFDKLTQAIPLTLRIQP